MDSQPKREEGDLAKLIAAEIAETARAMQEKLTEPARVLEEQTQEQSLAILRGCQERLDGIQRAAAQLGKVSFDITGQLEAEYKALTDVLELRTQEGLQEITEPVHRWALPDIPLDIGPLPINHAEAQRRIHMLAQTVMDSLQLPADERAQVTRLLEIAQTLDGATAGHGTVQTVLSCIMAKQAQSQEQSERRWRYAALGVALFSLVLAIIGILVAV